MTGELIMWKQLRQGLHEFKAATPGERFVKTYEHWQERAHGPAVTIIIITIGIVLMVAGLLLGLIPGVPGIVLGVLGLALIATRSRRVAIWLDWTEAKLRKRFGKRQSDKRSA